MEKIIRLAMASMRKNKNQSISFCVIMMISALLFNIGLITIFDYNRNFDKKAEELCSPDIVIAAQNKNLEMMHDFENRLLQDSRTQQLEKQSILIGNSEFEYANGIQNHIAILFHKEENITLGKWSIVEEIEGISESIEHPIYLPYLFQTGGNYKIGDIFKISFYTGEASKQTFSFTVAGFFEDTFFSTIYNTTTGFLLDEKEYHDMKTKLSDSGMGTLYSAKLKDREANETYVSHHVSMLKEAMPNAIIDSNHYEVLKSARTVTSSIGAMIIIGFSFLIIAVSLFVVKFRISSSIEEEMQNIGALKAIGYTGKQIILSFLIQFIILAFIGFLVGTVLSYFLLPLVSLVFAIQTGIVWKQEFSLLSLISTFFCIELPVMIVSMLTAWKVRKLHPIIALRFGVPTHNFKHNPIPLEKSNGSFLLSLAGKQFFHHRKQNLFIGIIIFGVTFATIFASVLYCNLKEDDFLKFISGEVSDALVEGATEETTTELLREVREMDSVEKAFYFYRSTITCEESYEVFCYVLDEFELVENPDWNYKGRVPKYKNEVSINGLLAQKLGKKIGDVITLSLSGKEQEYLITGFIQGSNYIGRDLCMTKIGYQRLAENFWYPTISVYMKQGEDTKLFLEYLEDSSSNMISYNNTGEIIKSSLGIYQIIVGILAIVIDIITFVIVSLVLYLVIKTMLIRQRKEMAIQKAIGFTTKQLALQNAFAFFPVILLGALLGCIFSYFGLNPFFSLLFSNIGLMKMNFAIPILLLVGTFFAITILGFIISFFVSIRVRKITPYSLMSE